MNATTKGLQSTVDQLRAELEALKPKPAADVGPVGTGAAIAVVFEATVFLTADRLRVVPEGDPAAASLLGRAGCASSIDSGWLLWLEKHGVKVARSRG